jgi:hypothetical protein
MRVTSGTESNLAPHHPCVVRLRADERKEVAVFLVAEVGPRRRGYWLAVRRRRARVAPDECSQATGRMSQRRGRARRYTKHEQ